MRAHCQRRRAWRGDNNDASPKTRHTWRGRALEDHVVGCAKASTPAGWLWAPRRGRHFSGVAGAKELHKWICNHYIRVLLIKTNWMIYNMLYKIWIKAANACSLSETTCLKGGGRRRCVVGGCRWCGKTCGGCWWCGKTCGGCRWRGKACGSHTDGGTRENCWGWLGIRRSGDSQDLWAKRVIWPILACDMKRLSVTLRCLVRYHALYLSLFSLLTGTHRLLNESVVYQWWILLTLYLG